MSQKQKHFKCKSEAQKKAIKVSYAKKNKQAKGKEKEGIIKFPFWARLKLSKGRTTLVIDEEKVKRKDSDKVDDCYVHREAVHASEQNQKYIESGDYEKIEPNPDKSDPKPMYLKRPKKRPKRDFVPHNKDLDMPEQLQKRYEGNNKKNDK